MGLSGYVGAATALAALGTSVVTTVQQSHAAANARKDREKVQAAARNAALADSQKQRQALNQANARTPDPESLLAAATTKPTSSSLLSGGGSSQLSLLQLGRLKLLGE